MGGVLAGLGEEPTPVGLVDQAGLIEEIPAELAPLVVRYDDPEAARAGMAAGDVGEYAVVAADYLVTGRIDIYGEDFNILGAEGTAGASGARPAARASASSGNMSTVSAPARREGRCASWSAATGSGQSRAAPYGLAGSAAASTTASPTSRSVSGAWANARTRSTAPAVANWAAPNPSTK